MADLSVLTVGEMVAERPARSRVFEHFGIDYCCGGKLPLQDACARKSVAVEAVLDALAAADAEPAAEQDWTRATLTALADHIEETHHFYLRQELPRLAQITEKVARVHGDRDPRLAPIHHTLLDLRAELESHMLKEEQILFPLCRQLDSAESLFASHCGSIANPIRVMEMEHDVAGNALERLSELSDGYTPPAWACNTYRAMLDALAQLEADLHQHIHKENNILFPRAIATEAILAGQN